MLDWVDGLTTFDKDGDYGVFAPLLQKEGLSENDSRLLQEAIFFERNNNSSQAKQKLSTVFNQIDDINTAIFKLFKPQLIKRLDWFKKGNRGTQEQKLAYEYLARQDYLRAVIFAQEGMISEQTIQDKNDPNSYDDRELVRQTLKENEQQFRFLNMIRNALAHGLGRDANKDLKRILGDESAMKQSLKQRFNNLIK
ncbi:TM1812 family CRISPR-associated protein [Rappaport israeli]|uniref:TM1812 family CRISPR-associated protein n=1 Tax=Rappaport israeli TaxID=1839807 RepID=UPI000B29B983|nr:TM1812 family CRISPR-associated protein [Rappaport israeli]